MGEDQGSEEIVWDLWDAVATLFGELIGFAVTAEGITAQLRKKN